MGGFYQWEADELRSPRSPASVMAVTGEREMPGCASWPRWTTPIQQLLVVTLVTTSNQAVI
jgi:hypothetical protein